MTTRPHVEQLESRDLPAPTWQLAIGYNDQGVGKVRYTPNGGNYHTFDSQIGLYFDASRTKPSQELRVAVGDVNRDGVMDVIAANGPHYNLQSGRHSPAELRVFDGATIPSGQVQTLARVTLPWGVGGAYLAAGDIDGDGYAEVVAGRDILANYAGLYPNVPNQVAVYSGRVISTLLDKSTPINVFTGIDDPNWKRGTTVAVGDVSGDRRGDVVVGVAIGGAPRVAVWDLSGPLSFGPPRKHCGDFFAGFISNVGVSVAVADLNRDGFGDVLKADLTEVAYAVSGGTTVTDGRSLIAGSEPVRRAIYDVDRQESPISAAVRMVVKDYDGDRLPDLAFGNVDGGEVMRYRGIGFAPSGNYGIELADRFDPFNGLLDGPNSGGVWVG
jgi:hypothetical protein